MATELKLRRGTTSQHSTFTGAEAEVTVDTDKETVVVHDGTTQGGYALAREDMSNVTGGDPSFDSINVDSGTLFVDSTNNRVGVGTSSPSAPTTVNRSGSDGEIVSFEKDGSTVGSIGTRFGGLVIGSTEGSDSHVRLFNNEIIPTTSDGSFKDNSIDFGRDGSRFKDLYLSGGVYLGGTGSANKLDDYELGSFSASFVVGSDALITRSNCSYVKIGELVYFDIGFETNDFPGVGTSTGNVKITGLPFAAATNGAIVSTGLYQLKPVITKSIGSISYSIQNNSTELKLLDSSSQTTRGLDESDVNTDSFTFTYLRVSGTYKATS